jgi:hypothetical protein
MMKICFVGDVEKALAAANAHSLWGPPPPYVLVMSKMIPAERMEHATMKIDSLRRVSPNTDFFYISHERAADLFDSLMEAKKAAVAPPKMPPRPTMRSRPRHMA